MSQNLNIPAESATLGLIAIALQDAETICVVELFKKVAAFASVDLFTVCVQILVDLGWAAVYEVGQLTWTRNEDGQ